jgi:hypothetical protein
VRLPTLLLIPALAPALAAQELEPRAYVASPVGASFFVFSWQSSSGGVVTDPTLPVEDVNAMVEVVAPGYGHTFNMFGSQALFTVALPYAWAWISGKVGGSPADTAVTRSGIGDMRAKFSVNFVGSPALPPAEFAKRSPAHWIVGASVAIVAPTGQYLPYHLVNIGTNRWAFKPELGVSYNRRQKLYLDLYAGVWLFTPNPAFFPGAIQRTQEALWSAQLHASYNFTNRIYAAFESTWYSGGASSVNGGPPSARLDNSRLGVLISYGFTDRQAVKLTYNAGAVARVGQDFHTFGLTYQVLWF